MDISAQCLRKEMLIEQFKIWNVVRETSEMSHWSIFCRKKKWMNNEGELWKHLSKMANVLCSGGFSITQVMCVTCEDDQPSVKPFCAVLHVEYMHWEICDTKTKKIKIKIKIKRTEPIPRLAAFGPSNNHNYV